jgi:hypothetical protein
VSGEKTRYRYQDALSGFFEFPTENARRLLPSHLEPAELHHGSGILAVTAFDFTESLVGAYGEVVMGVVVAPLLRPGERLPKSAVFPFLVGTSTAASRRHAIERWHLPHWMEDLEVGFERRDGRITARVAVGPDPVAELTVTSHSWAPVEHLYQCLMKDEQGAYLAHVTMQGEESEHEEERGRVLLHDHPFNQGLALPEICEVPFREVWMREGLQSFDPLVQLPA